MRVLNTYRHHYEPVHQPRMKVFALGLDENQKAERANDLEKKESKIPIDTVSATVPVQPQIILAKSPKNRKFGFTCGILSWFIGAFCLVLLCLAISEIAYHRQRDQAFLRLKWAELRQRMLGYELLSQQQEIDRMALEKQSQPQQIESLPLRRSDDPIKPNIMNAIQPTNDDKKDKKIENTSVEKTIDNNYQDEQSEKFGFLQALMDKIRKHAESMGLTGDMQVHVVEVKPLDMMNDKESSSEEHVNFEQSMADGFGEYAMPHQDFGPINDDYDNNNGGKPTFDRHSMKKGFGPMNRWENNNNWQDNNNNNWFGDEQQQQQNMPNFPHQFEGESNQLLLNRLYGINMVPPQQPFAPLFYRQDRFMPVQFAIPQQPWSYGGNQDNQMNNQQWFGDYQQQPMEVQTNQWNQPSNQDVRSQHFFYYPPQQQQWQQQQDQNQWAFPPQQPQQQFDRKPWYMAGGEQQQQPQMFQNDDWMAHNEQPQQQQQQQSFVPFQPNPAASVQQQPQWIDQTANVPPQEFNKPMDDINEEPAPVVAPESTAITMDSAQVDDEEKMKTFEQPQDDQSAENVISPEPQLETIDDSKFLPIRSDDKPIEMNDAGNVHPDSHLFQIDDPSSFKR